MKLFFITLTVGLLCFTTKAQSELIIPRYIKLPQDSTISKQLITDINGFLKACDEKNESNAYVLPSQKIETFILIDEFKGIEKAFGEDHFFKPYLNNIIEIDNNTYSIQISHIGTKDSTAFLRSMFNFIAHNTNDGFLFSSPLTMNTKNWKSTEINDFRFYYKNQLNEKVAHNYVSLSEMFDQKLKSENKTTTIYCTKNRTELLKLMGVDYKLDYNGRKSGTFSTRNSNAQLIIQGNGSETFDEFDTHDLWHDRLSLVIPRNQVNKPVDEGCAYLYGGSWGMSWQDIFKRFVKEINPDKTTDWLYYKENPTDFGESKAEHLMVDYVANALLIQFIEKEKGFEGVWQLLNCGRYEKGNENYFKMLDQIIGVSKKTYNKIVWKLIKAEMENTTT